MDIDGKTEEIESISILQNKSGFGPADAETSQKGVEVLESVYAVSHNLPNSQSQIDRNTSDSSTFVSVEDKTSVERSIGKEETFCIRPDAHSATFEEDKAFVATMIPLRDPSDGSDICNGVSNDKALKEISAECEDASIGKYIVSTSANENINICMQCCVPQRSKYCVADNNKIWYICNDGCLATLKERFIDKVVLNAEGDLRVNNFISDVNNDNTVAKDKFFRKCVKCKKKILKDASNLLWATMEFCNEFCLSQYYQKQIGSNCENCQREVPVDCSGKYCVRFGFSVRQFCSSVCLEEYKKGVKLCFYCQNDMSNKQDGFLTFVGNNGQSKDLCSPHCLEKYEIMSNNQTGQFIIKAGKTCAVCFGKKPIIIEYEHDNETNFFCGESCFVAFKFLNNITPGNCDMCKKYCDNKILEEHSIHYENFQYGFCSKSCQNIYIIAHRRIVSCSWCKVKKYNFDMIKRTYCAGPVFMMCSLSCLSFYQMSVNAVNSRKVKCDRCYKNLQPLYHLTMSDATIRNFCSNICLMAFQNQFPKAAIALNKLDENAMPVPSAVSVISSNHSQATSTGPTSGANSGHDSSINTNSSSQTVTKTQIRQQFIIKTNPIPPQRNVGTMCKILTSTKGVDVKPKSVDKGVQTDEIQDKSAVIPIPVPIYVPCPSWMYSMPFPLPFPFPLPVPVPIFIPTTRNSTDGIIKEIKKIKAKLPTDPFEAELLMMAEMVAGDKKEETTDSEDAAGEGTFSPEPVDTSSTFGDDVLQMALKMATDLDESTADLEGALTIRTTRVLQSDGGAESEDTVINPQPLYCAMECQPVKEPKHPRHYPVSERHKRGRHMEVPVMEPPPPEPVEKPDANMYLKYSFGVNAWKQWVTTKNAELGKSSHRVELIKPEILQLTAEELNYSLCLFVNEVRKPSGENYAPDTIYYLCLGIQQYLFENGRIDNIFCDTYYEKFTSCLDEIAKQFSSLYDDSRYIITRVEEEHLWESKQLGAHSPYVLLTTLMFFNTKHFHLTTVEEHMQLSFSYILRHWKQNSNIPGNGPRYVFLRFYPPEVGADASKGKKKVYEQYENEENPLRCPVKLYEFYLSKCPESVKTRNDVFYLVPERSCAPDSPVWYSTLPSPKFALERILHRIKMVKEINTALLSS